MPNRKMRSRRSTRLKVTTKVAVRMEATSLIAQRSVTASRRAGLVYVSDETAGYRRETRGTGFCYLSPRGRAVRDEATLRRIRSLVIPPAWTDVWICRKSNGHIQATGFDARGRKQYRYHPKWNELRETFKFDRLFEFAAALPRIRRRVTSDLEQPKLNRQRVLAAVVRLLETTLIRVGNEEYARENGSFGLTTMTKRHVNAGRKRIHFDFRGKSGVHHVIDLEDARLASIVRNCQELPGQDLFKYLDENGQVHDVRSTDVNTYLKEISGQEFTAKDFRTWAGTVLAARALKIAGDYETDAAMKRLVNVAIGQVADQLGNTKAVCRKCYIHPAVIELYCQQRVTVAVGARLRGRPLRSLSTEERAVLQLLKRPVRMTRRKATSRRAA
jgi:DNA topoisomerase-1